jgi:hypothetical protein
MKELDLANIDYIGADLVNDVVRDAAKHASDRKRFVQLDLLKDALPRVDLVLCRDLLVHLSFEQVRLATRNLKASGSTWLLSTTFPKLTGNRDTYAGKWRPLNLTAAPLCFPEPERLVDDAWFGHVSPEYEKFLGLWRIAALPD